MAQVKIDRDSARMLSRLAQKENKIAALERQIKDYEDFIKDAATHDPGEWAREIANMVYKKYHP